MKPLNGFRVLDLTHILAGPYCTRLLSDAGAEVIKIEYQPGDAYRHVEPFVQGKSVLFSNMNRGKKSLSLNLKTEEGIRIMLELAKKADVLVENFRPGAMKKLGLDYESIKHLNPRIVYCSISGYGQTGPYADKPGYDLIAQAESGVMALTGDINTPSIVGTYVVDFSAAVNAALAVLIALVSRERTGKGQYIDVALLDSAVMQTGILAACASAGLRVDRIGNKDRFVAPYGVFRTSDGYVAVACFGDRFFKDLCKLLELKELSENPAYVTSESRILNEQALSRLIEAVTSRLTTEDVVCKLNGIVPCCKVVEKIGEIVENVQVRYNRTLLTVDCDGSRMMMTGVPFRLSESDQALDCSVPSLGEHTDAILRELGYDEKKISALHEKAVI
jgi:formyl-CoA transferase/CoA:oxalate CoA-transferase